MDQDPYHDTGKSCFGGGMHCFSWHPACKRVTIHLEKSGNCKVVMENGEQSGGNHDQFLHACYEVLPNQQCFDTIGWAAGRASSGP